MKSTRRLSISAVLNFLSLVLCVGIVGGELLWGRNSVFGGNTPLASECTVCIKDQFSCSTDSANEECILFPEQCACNGGSCIGAADCTNAGSAGDTFCQCD